MKLLNKNPEVDRWFAEKGLANEKAMQRVREIILGADPRMTERVQYGSITFTSVDNMASFVQVQKKPVTLMFNRGQLIQGAHPHLEGTGPNARFMHFADVAEVEARGAELKSLAAAWCELMSAGSGAVRAAAKAASARAVKPASIPAAKGRPARATAKQGR
jgi:hypothetical protein